jgi:hypothetical protein
VAWIASLSGKTRVMRTNMLRAITSLGFVVVLGAACTKAQVQDLTETAARNAAAVAGTNAFEAEGHPLDGQLSCEAHVVSGSDRIGVDCTGRTKTGDPVTLSGEASNTEGDGLSGSFTGSVNGKEVFSQDCLGC